MPQVYRPVAHATSAIFGAMAASGSREAKLSSAMAKPSERQRTNVLEPSGAGATSIFEPMPSSAACTDC